MAITGERGGVRTADTMDAGRLTRSLDGSTFTAKHVRLYGITISGQFFDGFDATMLGLLMPGIAAEFHLSKISLGTLGSSASFGMLFGAIISGFMADRFGRRFALMFAIGEFAVCSVAAAMATSYDMLLAARALQGIGLGAEVAMLFAYLAEFMPIRRRGVLLASSSLLYQAAGVTAALIALVLVPALGWRSMFLVGGLPLVTVFLMWLYLPESVRFLIQRDRMGEAQAIVKDLSSIDPATIPVQAAQETAADLGQAKSVSVWNILQGGLLRVTLGIWFMNVTSGFVFFALLTWLPSLLIAQGFTFAHSLQYTATIALSGAIGAISCGVAMEAIGRRATIALCFLCGGIFLVLWSQQHTEAGILGFGVLSAFFCFGIAGALNSYAGEVYPTEFRMRATGWASGFLRIGGILAPSTIGLMLEAGVKTGPIFLMLGGIGLVSSIVAMLMIYETRGKSLEQITADVTR
ncbi:MAG TPA: MFS transporter [Stellaceae bacterium]|nr:MFS transporter [Stellaceae bacterium]